MSEPSVGDLVFHLVTGLAGEPSKQRFLFGLSRVLHPAVSTKKRPPIPGAWGKLTRTFGLSSQALTSLNPGFEWTTLSPD